MSLDTLLSPEQIHYEEALLQNGDHETLWLEYAESQLSDTKKAVFILDRAVAELPASTLLWNTYLSLPWKPQDRKKLIRLYEKALSVLYTTPAFWFKYLELLSHENSPNDRVLFRRGLDMALFSLDKSHHGQIWRYYLKLAEETENTDAASIYARFYEISSEELVDCPTLSRETCALKVAEHGDFTKAVALFKQVLQDKVARSRSTAEYTLEFLQILSASTAFQDDTYMEKTAHACASDMPEFAKAFFLVVAAYHSKRENLEKARHYHTLSFKSANTVADVVEVFDVVSNWEENQMEKLLSCENAAKQEEVRFRMKLFKRLLDQQSVLINDVLIRKNTHCIDHWLARADIYNEKDNQMEVINTYVTAIRRVNPLKATSKNGHTMASIWIKYADIYISQGDLQTANVIFSHSVKSQFKTVAELAELYIAWTEMIFTVSDDDALKHIELVLFVEESAENHSKKSVHEQVSSCISLWSFYIDILKSMIEEGEDNSSIYKKLSEAYGRLITLQIMTIRVLLEYADFTATQESTEKSYAIYEAGIHSFTSPQAQFHIWTVYLDKVVQNTRNVDLTRDLFDRCLASGIPGFQAYDIYQKYFTFEMDHGNLVRSVKIMREALAYLTTTFAYPRYTKENRNKIADDKFLLYATASNWILQKLQDKEGYREIVTTALQDVHLTLPCGIELGLQLIDFEKSERELVRVRALFKYLAGLAHPDSHVMKNVWQKWEQWEVENGTEDSYKQILKTRRKLLTEFKDVAAVKADINPMGFVIGESKVAKEEPEAKNPDVIELDMDM